MAGEGSTLEAVISVKFAIRFGDRQDELIESISYQFMNFDLIV